MTTSVSAQIGVIDPRLKLLINTLQQSNILRVISTHLSPGLTVAGTTAAPECRPGMGYFTPTPEITADVVQLVGIELESSTDFESIYRLEWRWWPEPVDGKAGSYLFEVETIAIVRDNNIRLI